MTKKESQRRRLDRRFAIALVSGGLLLVNLGCSAQGTPTSEKRDVDFARARGMSDMYNRYKQAHSSQPPKDEADFRAFLESQQPSLESASLTIDDMFVSPRNGQPFTWVYGKIVPAPQIGECFGYEKSASDGKRMVLGARGMFEVMEDTKFQATFPNAP